MTDLDRWLSVEEIANYLGVSKESIYRWLESRKMPAHKVGRQWKFKVNEVDEWVKNGDASEEGHK
ncbi:MAG: excisionase [Halobacteriovorax sp.]|nr:excisionase [Halobacteriovorax sp.]|tara:strand:- start:347891 stop:348085 length:195 start_codon:yes stop_codon:yes gene_type:complete